MSSQNEFSYVDILNNWYLPILRELEQQKGKKWYELYSFHCPEIDKYLKNTNKTSEKVGYDIENNKFVSFNEFVLRPFNNQHWRKINYVFCDDAKLCGIDWLFNLNALTKHFRTIDRIEKQYGITIPDNTLNNHLEEIIADIEKYIIPHHSAKNYMLKICNKLKEKSMV